MFNAEWVSGAFHPATVTVCSGNSVHLHAYIRGMVRFSKRGNLEKVQNRR